MDIPGVKSVEFRTVDHVPTSWQPITKTINTYKLATGGGFYQEIFKDMQSTATSTCNPYVEEFPNWMLNMVIVKDPVIAQSALKHYRKDTSEKGIFNSERNSFTQFMKAVFPEISLEEFFMTSSKENSARQHSFLMNYFSTKNVNAQVTLIESEADATLKSWAALDEVNLADKSKLFTSSVIGKLFLNYQGSYEDLTKAVDIIFTHIALQSKIAQMIERLKFWNHWKAPSAAEIQRIKDVEWAIAFMREAIDQVANYTSPEDQDPSICECMKAKGFSQNECRSTALGLFLAGQDTTAQLLDYIILKLAQDPSLQDDVRSGEIPIKNLIREGIRMFPPASLIARFAGNDTIMDVTLEDGTVQSWSLPKGSVLAIAPMLMARDPRIIPEHDEENPEDLNTFNPYRYTNTSLEIPLRSMPHFPLGGGVHLCVGAGLTEQEQTIFLEKAIQEYVFSTEVEGDPRQKTTFVNRLEGDLPVKVQKRNHQEVSINDIAM